MTLIAGISVMLRSQGAYPGQCSRKKPCRGGGINTYIPIRLNLLYFEPAGQYG